MTACSMLKWLKGLVATFSEIRLVNIPSNIAMSSEMLQTCVRQLINIELCSPCKNAAYQDAHLMAIECDLWPHWKYLASMVQKDVISSRHIIEELLTLDYKLPCRTRIDLKELLVTTMFADGHIYKTKLGKSIS